MSVEQVPKPNCYECVHRDEVPGSAHSKCRHPATEKAHENSMLNLMSMLGGGGMPPIEIDGIKIVGHPQGIRGGWFGWPMNFDPTWLLECDGFKPRPAKAKEAAA